MVANNPLNSDKFLLFEKLYGNEPTDSDCLPKSNKKTDYTDIYKAHFPLAAARARFLVWC